MIGQVSRRACGCVVVCGLVAGVMLWRDGSPAGPPGSSSTPARVGPAEPERAGSGARPGPRPRLVSPAGAHEPGPDRRSGAGPGAPASGGDDIAVTRALVLAWLVHDLPRKLPELELSAGDIERLADAVLRVREHNLRLRGLARTPDNAAEIRRLGERLVHDLLVFEDITGMSAAEFTGALSDEGITNR